MRTAIFDALFARMAADPDVFLVIADMGIGLVERFEEAYPDRFVNVGISEQNMIGVATGLYNVGYKPVCYSVSQFYLRAFEQIRLEVGLNGCPLILLGTTEGYDNAPLGPTHHAIDDWGALKAIPGLDIYCPSSVAFAEEVVPRALHSGRPTYIRIPKGAGYPASIYGSAIHERYGSETLFVTYGGTLPAECIAVADRCREAGVLVLNDLRPLPPITPILREYRTIVVAEDQFPHVGLYADICQLDTGSARVISLAPPHLYDIEVGTSPEAFHKRYSMDVSRFIPTGAFAKTDA